MFVCVYVHNVCHTHRGHKSIESPATGVTVVVRRLTCVLRAELGPLQVLLTTGHLSIPSSVGLKHELCR